MLSCLVVCVLLRVAGRWSLIVRSRHAVARAATHKVLVQLLWLDWPLECTAALQHSYVGFLLLFVALCEHHVFRSILLSLVWL
jgi:hypothetical protein